jgi:4-hydroxybenzoate polyprenyltransferase
MLRYTATIITLLGALATAFRCDPLNIYLLNAGTMLFLIYSFKLKDLSLIIVNSGLLLIYAVGLLVTP